MLQERAAPQGTGGAILSIYSMTPNSQPGAA
jgi:hypothetical protein